MARVSQIMKRVQYLGQILLRDIHFYLQNIMMNNYHLLVYCEYLLKASTLNYFSKFSGTLCALKLYFHHYKIEFTKFHTYIVPMQKIKIFLFTSAMSNDWKTLFDSFFKTFCKYGPVYRHTLHAGTTWSPRWWPLGVPEGKGASTCGTHRTLLSSVTLQ